MRSSSSPYFSLWWSLEIMIWWIEKRCWLLTLSSLWIMLDIFSAFLCELSSINFVLILNMFFAVMIQIVYSCIHKNMVEMISCNYGFSLSVWMLVSVWIVLKFDNMNFFLSVFLFMWYSVGIFLYRKLIALTKISFVTIT